jgi:uncharacterized cupin superfamily protein
MNEARPDCIRHFSEIAKPDNDHYPDSEELLGIGSPFGKALGLTRLGIHHVLLPPGRRTSYPHAESDEEEFAYVIEGNPDVWLDGVLHRLSPGEAVGFPAGTGIAHTFINNTATPVRLLVVGEANKSHNRIVYPVNPERKDQLKEIWWADAPSRPIGPHNGLPDSRK